MNSIYAALEIGTTRTVLAVGEVESGGRLTVTCHSEIASTGVRKSQILDIQQATQSVRAVLQQLTKKKEATGERLQLGNVYLVANGQHIKTDTFEGSVQIEGERVTNDDIDAVFQSVHAFTLPKDRKMLDIVEQDYGLDNYGGITDPKGMSGRILKLNTLQIHADHNRLQDAYTAVEGAHLEAHDPLFAVTCAAEAVLSDSEKRNGVLVLDLGGGSTGYAFYSDGYLVASNVIGVGGDHITNDIAHAFQTTNTQAEGLKTTEASATIRPTSDGLSARVKVEQGEIALLENRTISRHALDTVVNARLLELLAIVHDELDERDLIHRLHGGIVLTGGGAQMRNLGPLVEQVLGAPTRIGRPVNVDGLENEDFPAGFAAIAGALLYAAHNEEEPDSFFGNIFKKVFK